MLRDKLGLVENTFLAKKVQRSCASEGKG